MKKGKSCGYISGKKYSFQCYLRFYGDIGHWSYEQIEGTWEKNTRRNRRSQFSGTELSNIVYPKLTTVEPPLYQMGKKAAELILEKIKDPASPNHSIVLDAEIKMRASTPNE